MSVPLSAPPLWAPDYAASFPTAVSRFWKKYATFSGRASRREYWWSYLFLALGYVVTLTLLYGGLGLWQATSKSAPPVVFGIGIALTGGWFLATIVPWLALEARRLHDANLSGLLLLIHLASWPGAIVVFVMTQLAPNPIGRRFDAPPGEAPRYARVGNWPAAPGEAEAPQAFGPYSPVPQHQPPMYGPGTPGTGQDTDSRI